VCSICSELAPNEMAQGVASTSRISVSILSSIDINYKANIDRVDLARAFIML
jgi:hypothetical protein